MFNNESPGSSQVLHSWLWCTLELCRTLDSDLFVVVYQLYSLPECVRTHLPPTNIYCCVYDKDCYRW
uniref:Uncharacterized protein n=1 Tax=Anguilla anguilla TaxID=7936 RepID=A0A0E9WZM4_ANGAN